VKKLTFFILVATSVLSCAPKSNSSAALSQNELQGVFATKVAGKWNGHCNQDGDHYFRETAIFTEAGKGLLTEEYFKNSKCEGKPYAIREGEEANRGVINYTVLTSKEEKYRLKIIFVNQEPVDWGVETCDGGSGVRCEVVSFEFVGKDKLIGPMGAYSRDTSNP